MATSKVRRRLLEQEAEIIRLQDELRAARFALMGAQEELGHERIMRVAAQRGLVAYMREHGLGARIGYDPDDDKSVRKEIAAGRIPKPSR